MRKSSPVTLLLQGVPDMTDADKADVAAYPFDESKEADDLGVYGFVGEQGFNTLERRYV